MMIDSVEADDDDERRTEKEEQVRTPVVLGRLAEVRGLGYD